MCFLSIARWHVEWVLKKMTPWLRRNQIHSTHCTRIEAMVRALLIAWALYESSTIWPRTLLSTTASSEGAVVSSWLLSGWG
jgi:hypothetical protein